MFHIYFLATLVIFSLLITPYFLWKVLEGAKYRLLKVIALTPVGWTAWFGLAVMVIFLDTP